MKLVIYIVLLSLIALISCKGKIKIQKNLSKAPPEYIIDPITGGKIKNELGFNEEEIKAERLKKELAKKEKEKKKSSNNPTDNTNTNDNSDKKKEDNSIVSDINNQENAAGNTSVTDKSGNEIKQPSKLKSQKEEEDKKNKLNDFLGKNDDNNSEKRPKEQVSNQFKCRKDVLTKIVDPRYTLIKPVEKFVNKDNSVRFYVSDTTDKSTVILKLFLNGSPHNCEFFLLGRDKEFRNSSQDCLNITIINNRLHSLPVDYTGSYEKKKDGLKFKDIKFPVCLTENSRSNGSASFHQIYAIPEGENLATKCLKEKNLTNDNSCTQYLRNIAKGILHGISILNADDRFFYFGNINPKYLFYKVTPKETENYVTMDNMIFDANSYDDKLKKPESKDLDALGDTMISLLLGTDKHNFKFPIEDNYDFYLKCKEFFLSSNLDINLKSVSLNVPMDIDSNDDKLITKEEINVKLENSIFDFIMKLKNTGVPSGIQFSDAEKALKHPFILGVQGNSKLGNSLGSSPTDY